MINISDELIESIAPPKKYRINAERIDHLEVIKKTDLPKLKELEPTSPEPEHNIPAVNADKALVITNKDISEDTKIEDTSSEVIITPILADTKESAETVEPLITRRDIFRIILQTIIQGLIIYLLFDGLRKD